MVLSRWNSVFSDEKEKREARSIHNGAIVLHCMMCRRVISEEMMSFDIKIKETTTVPQIEETTTTIVSLDGS